jgi:hypothetical protein
MELRRVSHDLAQSLEKVKVLEGLLPIRAYCRQVRDTAGHWRSTEDYFKSQLSVAVTHGICPSCYAEHRCEVAGHLNQRLVERRVSSGGNPVQRAATGRKTHCHVTALERALECPASNTPNDVA